MNFLPKFKLKNAFLIFIFFFTLPLYGRKFETELNRNYFRLKLTAKKNQLLINKEETKLVVETLDLKIYEQMKAEIQRVDFPENYINNVEFKNENYPEESAKVVFSLTDQSVELFTFFQDDNQKYIADLWINSDVKKELAKRKEAGNKKNKVTARKRTQKKALKSVEKIVEKKNKVQVNLNLKKISKDNQITDLKNKISVENINQNYRDFRYGASFVWNYEPELPALETIIDLDNKSPDYFYPIKDRKVAKDDQVAHLQLVINFYKKRKFGLMYKAADLYLKKYPKRDEVLINFIKANALIREHIKKKNLSLYNTARSSLLNIYNQTDDYDLKIACLKYLIQAEMESKNYVKILEYGKKLFVLSVEEAEKENIVLGTKLIMHSLAKLEQIEKLLSFSNESIVKKVFSGQEALAYLFYIKIKKNKYSELIEEYNRKKVSLGKTIHPSILFNLSEALFRQGEYKESLKNFDRYVKTYSFKGNASKARLRVALIYEILEKPIKETLSLYKRVIDLSNNSKIRYEAKVRYVGLRICRKIKPNNKDLETFAFLKYQSDEDKVIGKDIIELKWLVRLRIFIIQNKFEDALAYFETIPIENVKRNKRKVFYLDGAEVLHGLIIKYFSEGKFAKVLKTWDVFKNQYNKFIQFNFDSLYYVAFSYLKLDLLDKFEQTVLLIKKNSDQFYNYPTWVGVDEKLISVEDLLFKKNYYQKSYAKAYEMFDKLNQEQRENPINLLYYSVVLYHQNKKKDSKIILEDILLNKHFSKYSEKEFKSAIHTYLSVLSDTNDKEYRAKLVTVRNIMKDTQYLNIKDRIDFLLLEDYSKKPLENIKAIEEIYNRFVTIYKDSIYLHRSLYLYGRSLINSKQVKEGKKILQELIQEDNTPGHIRELANSKLNDLNINI
jgi:tetratricopeptide (TPR) repeat protein